MNDIAILRLSKEAPLGPSIQIACLPDPSENTNTTGSYYPTKYGQDIYAMGFGSLGDSNPIRYPNSLQNVKLTLYNGAAQCWQVAIGVPKNWDSQLCAGTFEKILPNRYVLKLAAISSFICIEGELEGGKDTCQGKF